MASYLLEGYSTAGQEGLLDALGRIRTAAHGLTREGLPLRPGSAILVPTDETWFHVVEAPSVEAVEMLVRRAGLGSVRIAGAVELRVDGS